MIIGEKNNDGNENNGVSGNNEAWLAINNGVMKKIILTNIKRKYENIWNKWKTA